MATINLLPNDTALLAGWTLASGGSDAHLVLDEDHTGAIGGDSNRTSATSTPASVILNMDNFTEDFSAINSVQLITRAGNNSRGANFELETVLQNGTAGDFYTEASGTQAASLGYRTQTYTKRTTSDGSAAWTNTNLNDMRVRVDLDSISAGTTSLTYVYVIVDYNLPLAADNAIFFGTNF